MPKKTESENRQRLGAKQEVLAKRGFPSGTVDYIIEKKKTAVPKVEQTFPVKLHYMLNDIELDGLDHMISWQPHGRCFLVHQQNEFVDKILPLWFRQTKFPSFQRQLNLYGFQRISTGRDKGGYYHTLFLRGKPHLASQIQRMSIKGTKIRHPSCPASEPDFYNIPFLPKNEHRNESMAPTTGDSQEEKLLNSLVVQRETFKCTSKNAMQAPSSPQTSSPTSTFCASQQENFVGGLWSILRERVMIPQDSTAKFSGIANDVSLSATDQQRLKHVKETVLSQYRPTTFGVDANPLLHSLHTRKEAGISDPRRCYSSETEVDTRKTAASPILIDEVLSRPAIMSPICPANQRDHEIVQSSRFNTLLESRTRYSTTTNRTSTGIKFSDTKMIAASRSTALIPATSSQNGFFSQHDTSASYSRIEHQQPQHAERKERLSIDSQEVIHSLLLENNLYRLLASPATTRFQTSIPRQEYNGGNNCADSGTLSCSLLQHQDGIPLEGSVSTYQVPTSLARPRTLDVCQNRLETQQTITENEITAIAGVLFANEKAHLQQRDPSEVMTSLAERLVLDVRCRQRLAQLEMLHDMRGLGANDHHFVEGVQTKHLSTSFPNMS